MNPFVIMLGLVLLVALAAVIYTIRERKKATPPALDLSREAWTKEMARWVRSQPTDLDFPRYTDWKAEKALSYQQRYGVWPENY